MDAEEIGVGAFDGEAAGVVVDIIDHMLELTFRMQYSLVIMRGIRFPYAASARKDASKVHDVFIFLGGIVHFGDIIVTVNIRASIGR